MANLEEVPNEILFAEFLRRMKCATKGEKRVILIGMHNLSFSNVGFLDWEEKQWQWELMRRNVCRLLALLLLRYDREMLFLSAMAGSGLFIFRALGVGGKRKYK